MRHVLKRVVLATCRVTTRLTTRGTSLPEVMATVGVIAVLMAVAASGLNRRYADLETAHQELVNDVREMRLRASLKGAHFRLSTGATSYEIQRLQDGDRDGLWQPDPTVAPRVVHLPPGVQMAVTQKSGDVTQVEFDTRGVVVDPEDGRSGDVVVVVLSDQHDDRRRVEIWPSGQVQGRTIVGGSP